MKFPKRDYQTQTITDYFRARNAGVRRNLIVLPTGGGKTVVVSDVIEQYVREDIPVLFLAHRRELIKQSFAKLVGNGMTPANVGVLMAGTSGRIVDGAAPHPDTLDDDRLWDLYGRRRPGAMVQVASVDTFRNLSAVPKAGLVVFDEAHRALAKSYADIQHRYLEAGFLGLTATPFRADGKPLSDAFDHMIVGATYQQLIDQGFLVRPRVLSAPSEIDISHVKKSGHDYNNEELADAVNKTELVGNIVDHWKREGNNAPTFCFAVNVEHSKSIAKRFNEAGIPAEHVDANTDPDVRDRAIKRLRAGQVKVLCNCNVFTEGTDVPCVKTIILARPTKSEGMMMQMCGRGSRPDLDRTSPGYGLTFTILDHAKMFGETGAFSLPQEPRVFSLDAPPKSTRKKRPPGKKCPRCLTTNPILQLECINGCGYVFPEDEVEAERKIQEVEATLVEVNEGEKKDRKLSQKEEFLLGVWNELVDEWHTRNERHDSRDEPLDDHRWTLGEWSRRMRKPYPPRGSKVPRLTTDQLERDAMRRRGLIKQQSLFEDEDMSKVIIGNNPFDSIEREEVKL